MQKENTPLPVLVGTSTHSTPITSIERPQESIQSHTTTISSDDAKAASKRLIPVTKWPEYHDYPSIGGLRHLIFHEKTNGFHSCIRRIGRRVLIDEQRYFEWVESQNPASQK